MAGLRSGLAGGLGGDVVGGAPVGGGDVPAHPGDAAGGQQVGGGGSAGASGGAVTPVFAGVIFGVEVDVVQGVGGHAVALAAVAGAVVLGGVVDAVVRALGGEGLVRGDGLHGGSFSGGGVFSPCPVNTYCTTQKGGGKPTTCTNTRVGAKKGGPARGWTPSAGSGRLSRA